MGPGCRAGSDGAGKPCWKAKGTKGCGYKDKVAAADGIMKINYVSGLAGKGKADAGGANNAIKGLTALPTGLAAALSGNTQTTMQLVTSGGPCLGAKLDVVLKDVGGEYQARK